MSVQVYGCNHVAIEVDDIKKAVAFYKDVFNLEQLDRGEGDAFSNLASTSSSPFSRWRNSSRQICGIFGVMVRDEQQLNEVRKKLTGKYNLKLETAVPLRFPRSVG